MTTLLMAINPQGTPRQHLTQLALREAKAHQASVMLLCCVAENNDVCIDPVLIECADTSQYLLPEDIQDALISAEVMLRQALVPFKASGVEAKGMICSGDPARVILLQARRVSADMIIMGRRHLSSLNRLFKGSVSAAVLEHARCPVLFDLPPD